MIISIESLRLLLPNVIEAGRGEHDLLQKVRQFIAIAEGWFRNEFISEDELRETADKTAIGFAERIIAAHALWLAIPSLDITLSSTGFSVGSTDALTPASPARVRQLRESILQIRDLAINDLLARLPAYATWQLSHQAQNHRTVINFRDASLAIAGKISYDTYRDHFPTIRAMEDNLALNYLGPVLLRLRDFAWSRNLAADLASPDSDRMESEALQAVYIPAVAYLKAQLAYLFMQQTPADRQPSLQSRMDIAQQDINMAVEFIRANPDRFPDWHSSSVVRLFGRDHFPNSKRSGGYFF